MSKVDKDKIRNAVRDILEAIGEDPDREGLIDTPDRVARMYEEIFSGLHEDPRDHLQVVFQDEEHEELVIVKDIPFYSCCEHHIVPFYGRAHIAYLPKDGRLTGLSKLARLVDTLAKKPQLQERITKDAADIIIEAEHMCMTMRGVKKPGSKTITSAVRGIFEKDIAARTEAMSLINMR